MGFWERTKELLQMTSSGKLQTAGKDREYANPRKNKKAKARRRKRRQMRKQLQKNRRAKGQNPITGRKRG